MKPKPPRILGIAVVGVLILAACAESPRPRVGVKNVAAELVFGIPPVEEPIAPAGAFPVVPEEIDLTDFDEKGFFNPGPGVPAPKPRCPQAGPNDFPEREAPPTIEGKPKQGTYTWKVDGTQKIAGIPQPIRLNEFEQRRVQEVVPSSAEAPNFTFKTVQRKAGTGSNILQTYTFIVDTTNPSAALRGILLDAIVENRQDGSAPATSDYEPDIMYLPIPVQQGTANRFTTVSVDPRTFTTIRHSGFVKERKDVDACGKMLQTWLVDGEFFLTTGTGTQRHNYDYAIATHFGGLIVFEHSQSPCEASNPDDGSCTPAPNIEYNTNIGQVDPS